MEEKKLDKNSIIGFILIFGISVTGLFGGDFWSAKVAPLIAYWAGWLQNNDK